MKTRRFNIYLITFIFIQIIVSACDSTVTTDNWHLLWEDNFNSIKLNTSGWNVMLSEHSTPNELQYHDIQFAKVCKKKLSLEVHK